MLNLMREELLFWFNSIVWNLLWKKYYYLSCFENEGAMRNCENLTGSDERARDICKKREELGDYHQLAQELELGDRV